MGLTRQAYYAWRERPASARAVADIELSERIALIHEQTSGIYGAPRIHAVPARSEAPLDAWRGLVFAPTNTFNPRRVETVFDVNAH